MLLRFLSKYPGNVVARNWKNLLDCYGNEEMDEDLNECGGFFTSVKSKSPLLNAEVGATEDLHDAVQPLRNCRARYLL